MQQTGFKKSLKSRSDYVFTASGSETVLPVKYSYSRFLPKVLDQGEEPICVPCSVSAYLNWRENLKSGSKKDNEIDYHEIYDSKTSEGDGMTFKEAFKFLRHEGVESDLGVLKIGTYARVNSVEFLKCAIFLNGPCMGALPIYNESNEFWNKKDKEQIKGYHAISIVGYDEGGFIIRNSWGERYGSKGYVHLAEKDFKRFVELWTIYD